MAETGRRSGVLQKRKPRANGWTKQARAVFLRHLGATCNVRASCKAAGKDPTGLYRLRARDPGFARDWDLALEQGYQRLEAELLCRAMGDRLGESLDEGAAGADEEAGDAPAPVEPQHAFDPVLAMKLLAQWHGRDQQGRRKTVHLKQPSHEEVLKALDRKLTAMEKRLGRSA